MSTDGKVKEMEEDRTIPKPVMHKQNKNTWLFIGFLLLAGVLHSRDPDTYHFLVSIEYCAEYLIYAGLILSWTQSVNRRLLPTREKGYVLAAACLMLLFLAAQFTKYRIAVEPGIIRYCWYVYYIPILFIPTLFLMTCFRLFRGTGRGKVDEFLFLIPAGLLALGVLTNDLHMLAFIPNEDIKSLIGSPRAPIPMVSCTMRRMAGPDARSQRGSYSCCLPAGKKENGRKPFGLLACWS